MGGARREEEDLAVGTEDLAAQMSLGDMGVEEFVGIGGQE